MAEPRGRDGEAVEVKSAGGVSPPAGGGGGTGGLPPLGGGTGGLPRNVFEKWCHLVHSEIFLGAFFKCFKTSCLWGG